MEALNAEALRQAREKIKDQFSDPAYLDDIHSIRAQIEKKLSSAETQLNGAVQSKLDVLKRAVDLMNDSTLKLEIMTDNMAKIDTKIDITNTTISQFDRLKKVHNARQNLNKVIEQVEFFARIPERVQQLRTSLDEDSGRLKDVYLETLKLESYGAALMREVVLHQQRSDNNNKQSNSPVHKGKDSPEAAHYSRILSEIKNHLTIVSVLSKDIIQRLWGNLERIWDLASERPADLVTTFEIIEMHQQLQDRRKMQVSKHHELFSSLPSAGPLHSDIDIRPQAAERLQRNMEQRIEAKFIINLEEAMARGGSEVDALLAAATQLLSIMTVFKNEVSVCIPPCYKAMSVFLDVFDAQLRPKIGMLVEGNIGSLEVSDMMHLIDWLEFFVHQAEVFEGSTTTTTTMTTINSEGNKQQQYLLRQSCQDYNEMAQNLIHEYLHRIKNQVMEWFDNIRKQTIEIGRAPDGTLITSVPEDMFNVIHMQVAVAKEKLPKEHLKEVVNACLQVLREVQRQSYDQLEMDWDAGMDPETLCAVVNDMERLQCKAEEFSSQVISCVPQEEDREILEQMLEDVSSEYVSLAVTALGYLNKCVLADLEEPVFSKLFTSDWETGENLSGIVTVTLQDYFRDLGEWMPKFFFSKFAKECLISIINSYVKAMRRYAPTSNSSSSTSTVIFQFSSELVAARRLIVDMEALQQFFQQHASSLQHQLRGDFETALQEEFLPFVQLARVMSATHISGAENDAKALYQRYGLDGFKMVIGAISCNPSMDKNEKEESILAANKLFSKSGNVYSNNNDNNRSVVDSSNSKKSNGSSGNTTKSSRLGSMFGRRKT